MSLGAVLLGVLSDGPAHGYDLKRAYDERFPGSRRLAFGQVYATLTRLERDGLAAVVATEQEGGPERTVYELTEAGARELRDWLAVTETPGTFAADELVRKTVTALHAGLDADDFLRRQRSAHMAAMRHLTRERDSEQHVGNRIALDHTLLHLDADLRWLEEARQRVADDRSRT